MRCVARLPAMTSPSAARGDHSGLPALFPAQPALGRSAQRYVPRGASITAQPDLLIKCLFVRLEPASRAPRPAMRQRHALGALCPSQRLLYSRYGRLANLPRQPASSCHCRALMRQCVRRYASNCTASDACIQSANAPAAARRPHMALRSAAADTRAYPLLRR